MKTLLLTAHPDLASSRINAAWHAVLTGVDNVTTRYLPDIGGPTMTFDAATEQAMLLDHDRIVFQFPIYWYSCPPIMKAWIDQVFTFGFAYGPGGDKLAGRELVLLVSTGGPEDSYHAGGYNNFSIDEFLKPFQQTAILAKMTYLRPFVQHGLAQMTPEQIEAGLQAMLSHVLDPELDPEVKLARLLKEIEENPDQAAAVS